MILFQRTERAPKDRNIAETDCKKFAEMLTEKLLAVQKEREKEERVKLSMNQVMNRVCRNCRLKMYQYCTLWSQYQLLCSFK